jgi:hypothetical protein
MECSLTVRDTNNKPSRVIRDLCALLDIAPRLRQHISRVVSTSDLSTYWSEYHSTAFRYTGALQD